MRAHAALARSLQVPEAVVIENGDLLRLAPGAPEVVERVETGRLVWDGTLAVPVGGGVMRDRRKLMRDGAAFLALVVDERGELLADPALSTWGLFEEGEGDDQLDDAVEDVRRALADLRPRDRRDDEMIRESARQAVRRALRIARDKRPVVEVAVTRV
jgi:ribonuclease J